MFFANNIDDRDLVIDVTMQIHLAIGETMARKFAFVEFRSRLNDSSNSCRMVLCRRKIFGSEVNNDHFAGTVDRVLSTTGNPLIGQFDVSGAYRMGR